MPFCWFNHPLFMAAVAVVAIGVVVYEFMEDNKRRQPITSRRPPGNPPGSPPSNPPKPPPSNRPKPPPGARPGRPPSDRPGPPSSDRPGPPPSDRPGPPPGGRPGPPDDFPKPSDSQESPPGNNLRRRNINQIPFKENASKKLEESENLTKTSSTEGSQNNPNKKFDENNYCQNMLDKLTNDTKSVNENIKGEVLGHNIFEEESDSSESNLLPKGEEKVINQAKNNENRCSSKKTYKRKRKTKNNVEKSAKTHTDKKNDNCSDNSDHHESESISDSPSDNSVKVTKASPIKQKHASKSKCDQNSKSHSSNLYPKLDFHSESGLVERSLNSDEAEDIYKREMLKAFKNDLQNCEISSNTDNSVACSSEAIEKEEPSECKLCKGCEENPVNTRACPCNHAYLCVDCAVKVFRLCKKCSICLQDIEEFVQFAL